MLECKELTKSYKGKTVVNHINFHVKEGETFALIGANGVGKTTTIKMILGLVHPEQGMIIKKEKIKIGYSPETPYFPPFLTGYEVLMYYGGIQKIKKEICKKQAEELLQIVGLEKDKIRIRNYSKGMMQRLALAQALLGNPELLILDEPTAGLDAIGRHEMFQLISHLKEEKKTILINSHILNDLEHICDKGIMMKKGTILCQWDKEDLKHISLEELFLQKVAGR